MENIFENTLKELGILYKSQVKYEIAGRNSNYVIVDFVLEYNNKSYVIEYNGRQHYEFVKHFHKTIEEFEKQKKRDENVRKYFGDFLIEIPYTISEVDEIRSIILSKINEN